MSLKRRFQIYILILFTVVLSNSLFIFLFERYSEEKLSWVIHTHEVINTSNDLLNAVKDAETGQRGFLLTQHVQYLEPFHTGKDDAARLLAILKQLTADNPTQQKRLKKLDELIQAKFAELEETIELAQQGRLEEALEVVRSNRGKQLMDNIRSLMKDFINEEQILLERRKGEFIQNRTILTTLLGVEFAFFLFYSLFLLGFLNQRIFSPLSLLLKNTFKIEKGDKLEVQDLVSKDEMGYLLASFYRMYEKVRQRTEQLHREAVTDPLTGLYNRKQLEPQLETALRWAETTGTRVAAIFIDLNNFKPINDTYGHEAGDCLLKTVAERLRQSLRADDVCFRLGGDEFLVLLENVSRKSDIEQIARKLARSLNQPCRFGDHTIPVSASIGIALYPDDAEDARSLIQRADIAMYHHKKMVHADEQTAPPFLFYREGMDKKDQSGVV